MSDLHSIDSSRALAFSWTLLSQTLRGQPGGLIQLSSISFTSTMAGSSHSHQVIKSCWNFHVRQITNFSRPSTLFPKTIQGLFQLLEIQRLFKAGLQWRSIQERCFYKSLLTVTKNKQNDILVWLLQHSAVPLRTSPMTTMTTTLLTADVAESKRHVRYLYDEYVDVVARDFNKCAASLLCCCSSSRRQRLTATIVTNTQLSPF